MQWGRARVSRLTGDARRTSLVRMRVRVRLFAVLREAAGQAEALLELPEGATPESAWQALVEAHPVLGARRPSLTAAVNRRYATFEQTLHDGDEVVFVPPVSGGAS